jgi:nitrate reductase NapE
MVCGFRYPTARVSLRSHTADLLELNHPMDRTSDRLRKTEEFRSFIFFALVMAPVLAVIGIAGYGFIVWMYQAFIGGPPAG